MNTPRERSVYETYLFGPGNYVRMASRKNSHTVITAMHQAMSDEINRVDTVPPIRRQFHVRTILPELIIAASAIISTCAGIDHFIH